MLKSLAVFASLLAAMTPPAIAASSRDSLTLGMPVEPSGLDPTVAAPTAIREVTWGNLFEGLVTLDRDGKIVPLLAKSWTVSDDGLTYRFTLQPKVKFHNGIPFDASIVKFSLDRARATDSTNAQKQFFEPIQSIATPDPQTAVITLKHPVGLFLYWLAWGDAAMVEPSSVATEKTNPIGTGPFTLKEWRRGDRVVLARNASYWQAGTPRLSSVTFRFIGDPQAQAAALKAGDIDGFPNFSAPELFAEFQKDPRFTTIVGKTPRKLVAGMNCAKKPLDDVRVRQALMSAIDRASVIEGAYSGFGTPIGSHYAPSDPGYLDLVGVMPHDSDKAKRLLAEAGYANGLTLTIKAPQMAETTRTSQILQAMLAEIGVTLNIVSSEFPAQWIDDVFLKKNFEMTIIDHAEPMDIGIYARPDYYFGYHNPAFDALIAKADGTSDESERNRLFGDAQKILARDVPALYLFDLPRLNVWNKDLQGLWPDEPLPQMLVKDAGWIR
ncbi:ABC transporter substrate-binding protein [Lichenifustis flavocetrariae]|uniref:ABC transporter substrate-binding protein n=1 Tax=Lichenifustis flavocetrariae TaxID=2949735 RepID=A0AA42CLC5_9HYPH|nr:ABC transporter substrate-binding protein [Lichenifustis flavocetrariae]MCW6507232.1 ABC transporter substrate-binding protein [Lichenifustis flavocetrariae]